MSIVRHGKVIGIWGVLICAYVALGFVRIAPWFAEQLSGRDVEMVPYVVDRPLPIVDDLGLPLAVKKVIVWPATAIVIGPAFVNFIVLGSFITSLRPQGPVNLDAIPVVFSSLVALQGLLVAYCLWPETPRAVFFTLAAMMTKRDVDQVRQQWEDSRENRQHREQVETLDNERAKTSAQLARLQAEAEELIQLVDPSMAVPLSLTQYKGFVGELTERAKNRQRAKSLESSALVAEKIALLQKHLLTIEEQQDQMARIGETRKIRRKRDEVER